MTTLYTHPEPNEYITLLCTAMQIQNFAVGTTDGAPAKQATQH